MNLFTYGTLMVPAIFRKITGVDAIAEKAVLLDYARYRIIDAPYPGIIPQKGIRTEGVLYTGIDAGIIARLDAFEGKYYRRIEVSVISRSNDSVPAQAYVVRETFRNRLTVQPWCLKKFQEQDQETFLRILAGSNGQTF